MNNELSRELSIANEKVQYDTQCKRVLSQKKSVKSADEFVSMMNTLLSTKKTYIEKKEKLENDHQIEMSNELEKEMNIMCNLSDLVEEQGIEKEKRTMVLNLLKLGTVSEEDIMTAARITREELENIKKECI